jgi:polyisoprenoid-binding protein YceI
MSFSSGVTSKCRTFALLIFTLAFSSSALHAQKKLVSTSGVINITSNAQLEMIKATSDKVQGIIDPSNNQFAFSVAMVSFRGFNTELQRQHFNDSYVESDKYPKATFSGKIIEQIDFTVDGTYEVRAKGNLDIHGQKQIRIIKSKLIIKNGGVSIEAHFTVPLPDHNISIPKIVNQKIATEIDLTFTASMIPQ